jgi:hypothetical protein
VARIDRNEPVCVLLDFAGVRIPAIGDIAAMPDYLWVDRWTPDGRVAPITMQAYKRIDYAQGGYTLIGSIGTRPGDDQLEPELIWDWQAALTSSTLVRLLVER